MARQAHDLKHNLLDAHPERFYSSSYDFFISPTTDSFFGGSQPGLQFKLDYVRDDFTVNGVSNTDKNCARKAQANVLEFSLFRQLILGYFKAQDQRKAQALLALWSQEVAGVLACQIEHQFSPLEVGYVSVTNRTIDVSVDNGILRLTVSHSLLLKRDDEDKGRIAEALPGTYTYTLVLDETKHLLRLESFRASNSVLADIALGDCQPSTCDFKHLRQKAEFEELDEDARMQPHSLHFQLTPNNVYLQLMRQTYLDEQQLRAWRQWQFVSDLYETSRAFTASLFSYYQTESLTSFADRAERFEKVQQHYQALQQDPAVPACIKTAAQALEASIEQEYWFLEQMKVLPVNATLGAVEERVLPESEPIQNQAIIHDFFKTQARLFSGTLEDAEKCALFTKSLAALRERLWQTFLKVAKDESLDSESVKIHARHNSTAFIAYKICQLIDRFQQTSVGQLSDYQALFSVISAMRDQNRRGVWSWFGQRRQLEKVFQAVDFKDPEVTSAQFKLSPTISYAMHKEKTVMPRWRWWNRLAYRAKAAMDRYLFSKKESQAHLLGEVKARFLLANTKESLHFLRTHYAPLGDARTEDFYLLKTRFLDLKTDWQQGVNLESLSQPIEDLFSDVNLGAPNDTQVKLFKTAVLENAKSCQANTQRVEKFKLSDGLMKCFHLYERQAQACVATEGMSFNKKFEKLKESLKKLFNSLRECIEASPLPDDMKRAVLFEVKHDDAVWFESWFSDKHNPLRTVLGSFTVLFEHAHLNGYLKPEYFPYVKDIASLIETQMSHIPFLQGTDCVTELPDQLRTPLINPSIFEMLLGVLLEGGVEPGRFATLMKDEIAAVTKSASVKRVLQSLFDTTAMHQYRRNHLAKEREIADQKRDAFNDSAVAQTQRLFEKLQGYLTQAESRPILDYLYEVPKQNGARVVTGLSVDYCVSLILCSLYQLKSLPPEKDWTEEMTRMACIIRLFCLSDQARATLADTVAPARPLDVKALSDLGFQVLDVPYLRVIVGLHHFGMPLEELLATTFGQSDEAAVGSVLAVGTFRKYQKVPGLDGHESDDSEDSGLGMGNDHSQTCRVDVAGGATPVVIRAQVSV